MNVSLGLSERVSGRDIVRADEAVSDGARVAVSLGVPAVADALGLSLGVAVGLLDGVSLGLKERVRVATSSWQMKKFWMLRVLPFPWLCVFAAVFWLSS